MTRSAGCSATRWRAGTSAGSGRGRWLPHPGHSDSSTWAAPSKCVAPPAAHRALDGLGEVGRRPGPGRPRRVRPASGTGSPRRRRGRRRRRRGPGAPSSPGPAVGAVGHPAGGLLRGRSASSSAVGPVGRRHRGSVGVSSRVGRVGSVGAGRRRRRGRRAGRRAPVVGERRPARTAASTSPAAGGHPRVGPERLDELLAHLVPHPGHGLAGPQPVEGAAGAQVGLQPLDHGPHLVDARTLEGRGGDDRHLPPRVLGAQQVDGVAVVGDGPVGGRQQVAVGLVDHDDVGELHDPPLDALQVVAAAGRREQQEAVDHVGHRHLRLAHPDGLDHAPRRSRRPRTAAPPRGCGGPRRRACRPTARAG